MVHSDCSRPVIGMCYDSNMKAPKIGIASTVSPVKSIDEAAYSQIVSATPQQRPSKAFTNVFLCLETGLSEHNIVLAQKF